MERSGTRRGSGPSRRESLAGIPVFNEGVSLVEQDTGNVMMHARISKREGLLSRFLTSDRTRRLKLDEVGTFVVRQIDGRRSVLEISENLAEHYRMNRREAELSTVDFFKSLAARNVISIVIK